MKSVDFELLDDFSSIRLYLKTYLEGRREVWAPSDKFWKAFSLNLVDYLAGKQKFK